MGDSAPLYSEAWLPGPDGHSFYTRTYPAVTPQPRAVVFYMHGFADHSTRHERDHAVYPQHGITLFTYDQRGFGRTALDEENRSKDSAYGKTSLDQTYNDMAWWLARLSQEYPEVPLFIIGYSAGGGYTLSFCANPKYSQQVAKLSGVIALSPLLYMTYKPSTILVYTMRALSVIRPFMIVDAPMPEERFSRNPEVVAALKNDPLRRPKGTPRGLVGMIDSAGQLFETGWRQWPKKLSLLVIHGTDDKANSCDGAVKFFNKLDADDKKLSLYEDAFHDLVNEIEDIPQRVLGECTSWIEAHTESR